MDEATFQLVVADVSATVQSCNASIASRQLGEVDAGLDVRALARDVGTLIHSHCTKLAIAARPPRTDAAVAACLAELAKVLPALAALSQNCHHDLHGVATCRAVGRCCKYILSGLAELVTVVNAPEPTEARLAQTGILYESCEELRDLQPDHRLVAKKLQESGLMVADAVDDLQSWLDGDDDDDFGLNDLSDDDDDDDDANDNEDDDNHGEDAALAASTQSLSIKSQASERTAASEEDTRRRIVMLERIKILLKAIHAKRLTESTSVALRNRVFADAEELVAEIDEMAGEVQDRRSDAVYVLELEKAVVHRVEELLTVVSGDNAEDKWRQWIGVFRSRWRESVPKPEIAATEQSTNDTKVLVPHYKEPPTYSVFLEHHLKPLLPCLIDGLVDDWPIASTWRTFAAGQWTLNSGRVLADLGPIDVTVTRDNMPPGRPEPLGQFLADLEAGRQVYARDIHLVRHHAAAQLRAGSASHAAAGVGLYACPDLFKDDWLNHHLDASGADDYKFLYIGAPGTKTNLHRDVVASHSWSANLTGWKRWWLLPPACTHLARAVAGSRSDSAVVGARDGETEGGSVRQEDGELIDDLTRTDGEARRHWPLLDNAREKVIVIDQPPGATIFVPSGWYHQVLNLASPPFAATSATTIAASGTERSATERSANALNADAASSNADRPVAAAAAVVSINQNWLNAPCLTLIYANLLREWRASADAVRDLVEDGIVKAGAPFAQVVEELTSANVGLDFGTFWAIVRSRLAAAENYPASERYRPGEEYDHGIVRGVLHQWLADEPDAALLPGVQEDVTWISTHLGCAAGGS